MIALVAHIGNSSNLVMDPRADSYHLIVTLVDKLPAWTEEFGVMRGRGTSIAARGTIFEAESAMFIEKRGGTSYLIDGIVHSIRTASAENSALQRELEPLVNQFEQSSKTFLGYINDYLLNTEIISVVSDEIFSRGTQAIAAGIELHTHTAKHTRELLQLYSARLQRHEYIILAVAGSCLLLSMVLTFLVIRVVTRSIARADEVAEAIAQGNLNNDIIVSSNDEAGRLLHSLRTMQENLRQNIEADHQNLIKMTQIKQALENASANVMVADTNFNILYLNKSADRLFREAEDDMRAGLPHFKADELIGTNIDLFHQDPERLRHLLAELTDTYKAKMEIGSRTFQAIITPIVDDHGERQGTIVEWEDLTDQLRFAEEEQQRLAAERAQAEENQRIKQALDNVSGNVMVADDEFNIIYLNKSASALFHEAQDDLRVDLPNFNADDLLGSNIDIFHKNPAHQRQLLGQLASSHSSEQAIGKRSLRIVASPVFDEHNTRIGTAVEWTDRTDQKAVEYEVQSVVEAALTGDLSQRIATEDKQGFYAIMSERINELMAVNEQVLNSTLEIMSALASGNLNINMDTDYQGAFAQLQQDANATVAKLTEVITQIKSGAGEVMVGAEEISQGNTNLSQRTEEQASALQQTASSMEQMTSTVKQNASSARQANQLAANARDQAEQGGAVVSQAISAMNEINTSSQKIADIIGVIDEIAFQTNLLALNAAVEAARAGEQGRGFAVVASEVRNLAQRSATAAKEIKTLIEDSVTKVNDGSKLVDASGQTLEEIVIAVKKVSDIIAEIAAASQEQASGIEQVNKAIMQMDEMTQQNAALVEEAAAASEAMSEQSKGMSTLMDFFQFSGSSTKPQQESAVRL